MMLQVTEYCFHYKTKFAINLISVACRRKESVQQSKSLRQAKIQMVEYTEADLAREMEEIKLQEAAAANKNQA